MFLGAAVFAIVATVVAVLALRLIRALLSGRGSRESQQDTRKKPAEAETRQKSPSKEKAESKKEETGEKTAREEVPEETKRRFAASLFNGISEAFSLEETSFRIDEKAIADACISRSALSFIEYNNRELAGKDFFGFNLIVEDDERMVLTYNGCAVATLTKIERETTAVINGETVTGTVPAYRTNTFPPELKEGMVVSDLERMLEASERIKALAGDPEAVSLAMQEYFTQGDNVTKLKGAIDRKIQSKESVRKDAKQSQKSAKRLSPRPS